MLSGRPTMPNNYSWIYWRWGWWRIFHVWGHEWCANTHSMITIGA